MSRIQLRWWYLDQPGQGGFQSLAPLGCHQTWLETSIFNRGFNGKWWILQEIICKWWIFHCHIWWRRSVVPRIGWRMMNGKICRTPSRFLVILVVKQASVAGNIRNKSTRWLDPSLHCDGQFNRDPWNLCGRQFVLPALLISGTLIQFLNPISHNHLARSMVILLSFF